MSHILLLGGTAEAYALAERIAVEFPHLTCTTSLAGRTRAPRVPVGAVRVGGFGGEAGLFRWLCARRVRVLIDATHPFATRISSNAVLASLRANVELLRLVRPPLYPLPNGQDGQSGQGIQGVQGQGQGGQGLGRQGQGVQGQGQGVQGQGQGVQGQGQGIQGVQGQGQGGQGLGRQGQGVRGQGQGGQGQGGQGLCRQGQGVQGQGQGGQGLGRQGQGIQGQGQGNWHRNWQGNWHRNWQGNWQGNWQSVANEAEAAFAIPRGAKTFLALGSQRLAPFAARAYADRQAGQAGQAEQSATKFYLRLAEEPEADLKDWLNGWCAEIIVSRGPFDLESERQLFARLAITHLVARHSGGTASTKLSLSLPTYLIPPPPEPTHPTRQFTDLNQIVHKLKHLA